VIQLSIHKIKEIAEQLDCGFRCFINKHNSQLIFIPDTTKYLDIDTEVWETEMNELDANFGDYLEIEQLESRDSFLIMEEFIETLDDSNKLKKQLWDGLNRPKPFRQFKYLIDNSGIYRQQWFDFKNRKMQEWVVDKLKYLSS
jgi:hypothetical protein